MRPTTRQVLADSGFASDMELHARISVLEQQVVDQKEATVIALTAADKAIASAFVVAEKAVAKVELAAEKTYLEAAIHGLKEAFGQQIAHQKELTAQALASADKAVQKAEDAAQRRFESVNEFRATLSDQQSQLATKSEVNLRFKALEDRVSTVVEDSRELKGRHVEKTDSRALMFSIIAAGGTLGLVLFNTISHFSK